MLCPGTFLCHGEVAVIDRPAVVAPGGIDVVFGAVQCRYRPDVGVVGEGGAVNAFQL